MNRDRILDVFLGCIFGCLLFVIMGVSGLGSDLETHTATMNDIVDTFQKIDTADNDLVHQDWTPTITCSGGSLSGTVTAYARYIQIGDMVHAGIQFSSTTSSDCTRVNFTAPVTANQSFSCTCRQTINGNLNGCTTYWEVADNTVRIQDEDDTTIDNGSGAWYVDCVYEKS